MVKRLTHRTLTPAFVGSIPTTPAHLSMFLHLLVRFQLGLFAIHGWQKPSHDLVPWQTKEKGPDMHGMRSLGCDRNKAGNTVIMED